MIMPATNSAASYHQAVEELDTIVIDLEEHASLLTGKQKATLLRLSGHDPSSNDVSVDQVQKQFEMVLRIRDRLLDEDGELLAGIETRALASFSASVNSLIQLFLRNKGKMDHIREVEHLRAAVIQAVETLDKPAQIRFFQRFDELSEEKG
jgi:hypothetical protein